jgi:thioredoxin reductase
MMPNYIDYAVIGWSFAGVSAASTLAQSGNSVVIFDFDGDTDSIADHPRVQETAVSASTTGTLFEEMIELRLRQLGVSRPPVFHLRGVQVSDSLVLTCGSGEWRCKGAIFAPNGSEPGLSVSGVDSLFGFGVSYSAADDGPYYRGTRVAVYGDSPRALEHAAITRRYASETTVLLKQSTDNADPAILTWLKADANVRFVNNVSLQSFRVAPDKTLSAIEVDSSDGRRLIDASALFVAQHVVVPPGLLEASGEVVLAGLAAGVKYWRHADLVADGMRAANQILANT